MILDNTEIQQISQELSNKIDKHRKELDGIRKKCSHDEYKLELVHFKRDKNITELKKICKYCSLDIGYPTQKEIKIWKLDE